MNNIVIKEIKTIVELNLALDLCYRVLGKDNINSSIYGYDAWIERLKENRHPMVYAEDNGKIISAVMGRAENDDSLVVGLVACDENYRNQGITKAVLSEFENEARKLNFKYITLGSEADGFYEKCGYKCINKIERQSIYQKIL